MTTTRRFRRPPVRYNRHFPPNWSAAEDGMYWREFSAAKAAAKKAGVELDRHALHAEALGADKSHVDFNNDDFDKVLGKFREWSAPGDLNAQLKALSGRKRRLIFGIERTAKKLKVGADYVLEIAKTQTGRAVTDLEAIDEDELENVRIALAKQIRR